MAHVTQKQAAFAAEEALRNWDLSLVEGSECWEEELTDIASCDHPHFEDGFDVEQNSSYAIEGYLQDYLERNC